MHKAFSVQDIWSLDVTVDCVLHVSLLLLLLQRSLIPVEVTEEETPVKSLMEVS